MKNTTKNMNTDNYSILFIPRPQEESSPLYSWNVLAVHQSLKYGIQNHKDQTLVIYTSKEDKHVFNVFEFAMSLGFKDVVVYANLEKFEAKNTEFVEKFVSKCLSLFHEKPTVNIDKIFWTFGTIAKGIQSYEENSKLVYDAIHENENNEVFEGDYVQHILYASLLQYFQNFGLPTIHQLIIDPVETDIGVYLPEFLQYNIRRHFVHQLSNRSSTYNNRFIVEPFFDKSSPFYVKNQSKKEIDFAFGFTAYDETRKQFLEDLKKIIDKKHELYYCYTNNEGVLVDIRLPYEEYLQRISVSKTTLLVPAYDMSTFSMHRFVEAISVNCLPIIFEAAFEYGFAGFPDTITYVEQHLLLHEITKLNDKIESLSKNHKSILAGLLKTSYFTNLTNQKNLKQINRLFN